MKNQKWNPFIFQTLSDCGLIQVNIIIVSGLNLHNSNYLQSSCSGPEAEKAAVSEVFFLIAGAEVIQSK